MSIKNIENLSFQAEITTEEQTEEKKEKTQAQKAEIKFYLTLKEKYEKAAYEN